MDTTMEAKKELFKTLTIDELTSLLPSGFIFSPTDEELLVYLHKKVKNQEIPMDVIKFLNIYEIDPNSLVEKTTTVPQQVQRSGDKKWYLFTELKKKPISDIINRIGPCGHWLKRNHTVIIKAFDDDDQKLLVGERSNYSYFAGVYDRQTKWRIQEFVLKHIGNEQVTNNHNAVCQLYIHNDKFDLESVPVEKYHDQD